MIILGSISSVSLAELTPENIQEYRILHECSCVIEFIKRVGEKR